MILLTRSIVLWIPHESLNQLTRNCSKIYMLGKWRLQDERSHSFLMGHQLHHMAQLTFYFFFFMDQGFHSSLCILIWDNVQECHKQNNHEKYIRFIWFLQLWMMGDEITLLLLRSCIWWLGQFIVHQGFLKN